MLTTASTSAPISCEITAGSCCKGLSSPTVARTLGDVLRVATAQGSQTLSLALGPDIGVQGYWRASESG